GAPGPSPPHDGPLGGVPGASAASAARVRATRVRTLPVHTLEATSTRTPSGTSPLAMSHTATTTSTTSTTSAPITSGRRSRWAPADPGRPSGSAGSTRLHSRPRLPIVNLQRARGSTTSAVRASAPALLTGPDATRGPVPGPLDGRVGEI